MKNLKVIVIISFLLIFTTLISCGRNGEKEPYPNYPKSYPKVNNL